MTRRLLLTRLPTACCFALPLLTLPLQGRVTHRLLLTYKLSLAEAGKVTPTLPMLNRWVPGCRGGRAGGRTAVVVGEAGGMFA